MSDRYSYDAEDRHPGSSRDNRHQREAAAAVGRLHRRIAIVVAMVVVAALELVPDRSARVRHAASAAPLRRCRVPADTLGGRVWESNDYGDGVDLSRQRTAAQEGER